MSEEKSPVQDSKEESTTASEKKQPIESIPYARFKELVDEKNTMKSELDSLNAKIKSEAEARQLKELEAKGNYDQIMADMNSKLQSAESKAKQWDDYQETRRDAIVSNLPENDRAIYGDMPLDKLELHWEKIRSKSPAPVDNSKPTDNGGYESLPEWAQNDAEGYSKANTAQTSGNIKIAYGD